MGGMGVLDPGVGRRHLRKVVKVQASSLPPLERPDADADVP
jgi:hypothetical protein